MKNPNPFEWSKHLEETGIVKTEEMSNEEFYSNETKTELDKFKELYASLGTVLLVERCKVSDSENELIVTLSHDKGYSQDAYTQSDKFEGYMGFHSTIDFTEEGKFIRQGFWE